jgi:hypothetical protein
MTGPSFLTLPAPTGLPVDYRSALLKRSFGAWEFNKAF